MKRLVLACLVVVMATVLVATTAFAQTKPEFQLGFKALADQVPTVAGEPTEAEHWGVNGDSLQTTTTGLMAWRKSDNWTAFTNGSRSWVNGPSGVMERGNEERFPWEAPAPPKVGTSRVSPVPFGQAVAYTDQQGHTFEVAVLQVVRNAFATLKRLGASTEAPKPGMDYVDVMLRLRYVSGGQEKPYATDAYLPKILSQNRFWAMDSFSCPTPYFSGHDIFPGAVVEGWAHPTMIPLEAMDEAILSYDGIWLALK